MSPCCEQCAASSSYSVQSCKPNQENQETNDGFHPDPSMASLQAVIAYQPQGRISTLGGNLAPSGTTAMDIAEWILPAHRAACALVISMSQTWARQQDGYQLIDDPRLRTVRIGVWINHHLASYIVGCRATGIGKEGAFSDLKDDQIISGIASQGRPSCDLNIVQEGKNIISTLLRLDIRQEQIVIAGYSLGGAAALCLGNLFPGTRIISFFGGAPPTNPVLTGPGPGRATHYHVVGDLVSSHVGPQAAQVIRIDKGFKEFSFLAPHLSGRFLRNDGYPSRPATADHEDDLYVLWALDRLAAPEPSIVKKIGQKIINYLFPTATQLAGIPKRIIGAALNQFYAKTACQSPIPGSTRFDLQNCRAGTLGAAACLEDGLEGTCNLKASIS